MSPWMVASVAMLPAVAVPILAALHGRTSARLVAMQLGSALTTLLLALLTFAFDQSSFIDLALALSLLSLPGTMVMLFFLERWL
jgi:multisubunit Na+/H+ antiporter MnhF subunit